MKTKPFWKEHFYFVINIILTLGAVFLVSLLFASRGGSGLVALTYKTTLIIYLLFIVLFLVARHGLTIGNIQGNGVRITADQFPEIHAIILEHSNRLSLKRAPAAYMLQAGGLLNAFATRSGGRNYIVLFSDVLEKAYDQGRDVVSFIVAHEMAHIKRHHVTKMVFTSPAVLLFPFRFAYSRACEYTCDAFATELAPAGAERGMLLLSAGKSLFERVNPEEFLRTHDEARGFWKWFAEKMSTHPYLPDRIRRLRGVRQSLAE